MVINECNVILAVHTFVENDSQSLFGVVKTAEYSQTSHQ